jgi:AcrR family transcriptional regulator
MVATTAASVHVPAVRQKHRRGRPRDDRLDAAIVDATIAEVGAKGWAGATVEGIAARAGVGRGSIYRRWASKQELFQHAATAVTRPSQEVDTGSFADDLLAAALRMAETLTQPEIAALLPPLLSEAANDGAIRETLKSFVAQSRQQAIGAVERARQRGDILQSTDAETIVDMLAGALVYRRLFLGATTGAAAIHALVDQVVRSCSTSTATEEDS